MLETETAFSLCYVCINSQNKSTFRRERSVELKHRNPLSPENVNMPPLFKQDFPPIFIILPKISFLSNAIFTSVLAAQCTPSWELVCIFWVWSPRPGLRSPVPPGGDSALCSCDGGFCSRIPGFNHDNSTNSVKRNTCVAAQRFLCCQRFL